MSDDVSIIEFGESVQEAEKPELLPEGQYLATIIGAVAKIGTNSGKKYGSIQFRISPESFPTDYPADIYPEGMTLTFNRVGLEDNPKARYLLRQFMENIGAPPIDTTLDMGEWLNLEALVTVKHETYEGVERENISRVDSAA